MARKTKTRREYLNRQPKVGDCIVVTYENMFGGFPVGTEMVITQVHTATGNCVFAWNNRTGKIECIHDDYYRIYADVDYEKVGVDVVEKKFLGFGYKRKEIEKWREVSD